MIFFQNGPASLVALFASFAAIHKIWWITNTVHGFGIVQHKVRHYHYLWNFFYSSLRCSTDDIDNNFDDNDDVSVLLQSSYPDGTLAGLRGEAIRSALTKTKRCIGWRSYDNLSGGGMLRITGNGMIDFLNGKLTTTVSSSNGISYKDGCLLDGKGHLIDVLRIAIVPNPNESETTMALILPSFSSRLQHTCTDLFDRFEPFIFPMDDVKLTPITSCFTFTIASTQYRHVQKVIREQLSKMLPLEIECSVNDDGNKRNNISGEFMIFPGSYQSTVWIIHNDVRILVVPTTGLPKRVVTGYTFVFFDDDYGTEQITNDSNVGTRVSKSVTLGRSFWNNLMKDDNVDGPIEVGPLEYETLRIEAGQCQYGNEYGIDLVKTSEKQRQKELENTLKDSLEDKSLGIEKRTKNGHKVKSNNSNAVVNSLLFPTSPIELNMDSYIDETKGCYVGQEGVSSVLKNKRGPPRKLYQVVFEDSFNVKSGNCDADDVDEYGYIKSMDSKMLKLRPGQTLTALGSGGALHVGTLTSIAEPGGTGLPNTVALALIKRSDSIRKKMKDFDIELTSQGDNGNNYAIDTNSILNDFDATAVNGDSGGLIPPPPLDPLDGLEVIVDGTFMIGVLRSVPDRRGSWMSKDQNMFNEDIQMEPIPDYEMKLVKTRASKIPDKTPPSLSKSAPSSSFGANTIATTKQNGDNEGPSPSSSEEKQIEAELIVAAAEAEEAAAEAKRKAAKMELLRKRAKEAMERRRKRKRNNV